MPARERYSKGQHGSKKHFALALKGGGFLRHAAPQPVTALILSDVIGDDLSAIASGPTVGPIGTVQEAMETLQGAGLERCREWRRPREHE